jgi:hypothetical protein
MSDLKKALKEEYDKKNAIVNPKSLMKMIEEAMDALPLLERTMPKPERSSDTKSKKGYSIPKIRITEAWGEPGSDDRKIIEKFAANIGGETIQEKLNNINRIMVDFDPNADIPEILSTMVVTEVLDAILKDFTESAGGFIFEGFLAGLLGGKQIQDTGDLEAGVATGEVAGKPITDIQVGDRHYSLKLLGEKTGVKGSFKNMVEHFRSTPHIVYLDARRTGDGLVLGEFEITLKNFYDVFVEPFLKEVKGEANTFKANDQGVKDFVSDIKREDMTALKSITFDQSGFVPGTGAKSFEYGSGKTARDVALNEVKVTPKGMEAIRAKIKKLGETEEGRRELMRFMPVTTIGAAKKFEGTKAEKLFGNFGLASEVKQLGSMLAQGEDVKQALLNKLARTPAYVNAQQFEFTKPQAEKIAGFEELGTLSVSEDALKKTWSAYGEKLREDLEPIYNLLNNFSQNIDTYFLSKEPNKRKTAGDAASSDAKQLKTSVDKAVK